MGVVLYDNPKLGRAINDWFDDFVLKDLKPHLFGDPIQKYKNSHFYYALHNTSWKGECKQPEGPGGKPLEIKVNVNFRILGETIIGDAHYEYDDSDGNRQTNLTFIGQNQHGYLTFQYDDDALDIERHGLCMLKLGGTGKTLIGYFTGYAPELEDLTHGSINLKKLVNDVNN